jgi:hypothetical protein
MSDQNKRNLVLPVKLAGCFNYAAKIIDAMWSREVLMDALIFFKTALDHADEYGKIGVEKKSKQLFLYNLKAQRLPEDILLEAGEEGRNILEDNSKRKSFSLMLPENIFSKIDEMKVRLKLKSRTETVYLIMTSYTGALNEVRKGSKFVYVGANKNLTSFHSLGMGFATNYPLEP